MPGEYRPLGRERVQGQPGPIVDRYCGPEPFWTGPRHEGGVFWRPLLPEFREWRDTIHDPWWATFNEVSRAIDPLLTPENQLRAAARYMECAVKAAPNVIGMLACYKQFREYVEELKQEQAATDEHDLPEVEWGAPLVASPSEGATSTTSARERAGDRWRGRQGEAARPPGPSSGAGPIVAVAALATATLGTIGAVLYALTRGKR